jgi:beta-lactamase class A
MITESDNTATKILIDRLGRQNINKTIASLGLKNTYIGTAFLLDADNLNYSTPKDMALLLHKLYNLQVINPQASQRMLEVLIRQKHRWGIPKFLPQNIIIANKTGALSGVRNDAAIVFYKDKPYILSIFSNNVSSNLQGNYIVRTISWEIFNWKENLYTNNQFALHEQSPTQKNNL